MTLSCLLFDRHYTQAAENLVSRCKGHERQVIDFFGFSRCEVEVLREQHRRALHGLRKAIWMPICISSRYFKATPFIRAVWWNGQVHLKWRHCRHLCAWPNQRPRTRKHNHGSWASRWRKLSGALQHDAWQHTDAPWRASEHRCILETDE